MLSKYAIPQYLVEFFDDETKKSHARNELNKAKLRKAIRRKERIRAGLMFGGLITAFCSIAAIETTEITTAPLACCLHGLLAVTISSLILGD